MNDKKLWDIIKQEKIRVIYEEGLSHTPEKVHGIYMYDHEYGSIIILDKILHSFPRLHRCVLAEEIGHYFTTIDTNLLIAYTSYANQIKLTRAERKAMQFATNLLIPNQELTDALDKGYRNYYELAEYFDVTEDFIRHKLDFLKTCFCQTCLNLSDQNLSMTKTQPSNIKHGINVVKKHN